MVEYLKGKVFRGISAAKYHTIVLGADGEVRLSWQFPSIYSTVYMLISVLEEVCLMSTFTVSNFGDYFQIFFIDMFYHFLIMLLVRKCHLALSINIYLNPAYHTSVPIKMVGAYLFF